VSPVTVLGPVVADLRQVFLDLPQPVAVVTCRSPSGEAVGMTVSSLTSVSLAPPLVLFCPTVTSRAWAAAREHGSFAVNILGHRQGVLAMRFAGPDDRLAACEHCRPTTASPRWPTRSPCSFATSATSIRPETTLS
jgi:3-hydroxy-9,10-secoandrosta-1,3,5(10)-triene-9,17-dione monooxygenase reductase component